MTADTDAAVERRAKKLRVSGYVGTLAYLAFLVVYSIAMWPQLITMTPHDFAECLAGAFGPLAFLWVVLGYLQQGDELRHSARALYLQGEELRQSVEQQREMVAISRAQFDSDAQARADDQLASDAAASPRLRLFHGGHQFDSNEKAFDFLLKNTGPTCTDVIAYFGDDLGRRRDIIETGGGMSVTLTYPRQLELEDVNVRVTYISANGKAGEWRFRIPATQPLPGADFILGTPESLTADR